MRYKSGFSITTLALLVILSGCGGGGGSNTPPGPTPGPQPPPAAAPSVSVAVQPGAIVSGSKAALTWSSKDATSVSIDQGIGPVATSGSMEVSPTATTHYQATAKGPGGTTSAGATLTVDAKVTVQISASPDSITPGKSSKLTWSSAGATSISLTPGIGTVGPDGSIDVSPSSDTTYTATATGPGGTARASVKVKVKRAGIEAINHIIFMLQENRSFDTYFGHLNDYRAAQGLPTDVDGMPAGAFNPSADGKSAVYAFHFKTMCMENVTANWNSSHADYNRRQPVSETATLDGFVLRASMLAVIDPQGIRAMGYYDASDLPYYYYMASQFATSDRWFAPVLSRTNSNRLYVLSGTSAGYTDIPTKPLTNKTIFELLEENGISWKVYTIGSNTFLDNFQPFEKQHLANIVPIAQYFTDLDNDTLPSVALIETTGWSDEHPRENTSIQAGAAEVAKIINALMKSSSWEDSAFIWTFDEGGALYDHVPPIPAPNPDGILPVDLAPNSQHPALLCWQPDGSINPSPTCRFEYTGFRVPLMVISPFTKPHYVSHTPTDYTAILKLIETRFNLPNLTERDKSSIDMTEFFDFVNVPWQTPPTPPVQPQNGLCDPSQMQ